MRRPESFFGVLPAGALVVEAVAPFFVVMDGLTIVALGGFAPAAGGFDVPLGFDFKLRELFLERGGSRW
jgi:hypothetical protein